MSEQKAWGYTSNNWTMFSMSSAHDSGNQGLLEVLCEVTSSLLFRVESGEERDQRNGAETYPMVVNPIVSDCPSIRKFSY